MDESGNTEKGRPMKGDLKRHVLGVGRIDGVGGWPIILADDLGHPIKLDWPKNAGHMGPFGNVTLVLEWKDPGDGTR